MIALLIEFSPEFIQLLIGGRGNLPRFGDSPSL
jgi:hypothetical protein